MDANDLLLSMYNEQVEQARQQETMRATATNLTFAAGTAITSLIFANNSVNSTALAALLIGVGVFGCAFSLKHYERNRMHVQIGRRYRAQLENNLPESRISQLRTEGENKNKLEYPRLSKLRLHWLWNASSLFFSFVGALFLILKYAAG